MISDDIVAQFQRDGAVRIRQLFRPHEIEELRAGIELNLAAPSRAPKSRAARMIRPFRRGLLQLA